MSASVNCLNNGPIGIEVVSLDVSRLVGYEIKIYTEQFPGKELASRVVSAEAREIAVDSGSSFGLIGNLISPQQVILQFPYKGQDIVVRAQLRRTHGGQCHLIVEERMIPLSRRQHHRINRLLPVKLATYPVVSYGRRELSSLRWIATQTINVSSGGVMISIPSFLEKGIYLLIHIDCEEISLPPLLLGRVCHCYQTDKGQFRAGIEFIVKEIGQKLFPPARLRELPQTVLNYTSKQREKLNKDILALESKEKDSDRSQG